MLKMVIATVLITAVVAAEDSPLVALAKRTNRKSPKARVITNDTVTKSSGRLSVAPGETPQAASTSAPAPAPAAQAAAPKQEARPKVVYNIPADKTPKAPEQPYTGPAASTVRNVEPASSARNVDPQSSARVIEPYGTTVRTITPQSTVTTVQPQSTARYVTPQSTNQPPK